MVQRSLKDTIVCVVGLGYVGYPLANAFSQHLRTIGYDLDAKKIDRINAEPGNKVIATTDPPLIREADVVIIAVPTPVTKAKDPDISYVVSAAETIGQNLKDGALVVLESMVYPGLTEEIVVPTLEAASGRICGKDFFVGYSPERINSADIEHTLDKITTVVDCSASSAVATTGLNMLIKSTKVRVGVLMDSLECSPYLFDTISSLAKDQNIELYLLLNKNSRNKSSTKSVIKNIHDTGICRFIDAAFFKVCVSLAMKIHTTTSTDLRKHFLTQHLNIEIFTDKVLIKPKLSRTIKSKGPILASYDDIDVQKINALGFDLILLGNVIGIPQGKILSAAKKGIISFYYGDNRRNRRSPPGFWEVYFKEPATRFGIQILNENPDDGDVIFRGEIPTALSYVSNLVNLCRAANPFMARIIRDSAATGALPPILPKTPYSNTHQEVPKFTVTLAHVIRTGTLFASIFFKKTILKRYERWSVAFIESDWMTANLSKATVIKNPKGRFLADPFIMNYDNKTVIFVEDYHYSSGKGAISVVRIFPDGSYKIVPDIIKENFHLSFPYVFEYMGNIYMIPESHEAKAIRLYKCIRFPDKWEYQFNLMESVSAVDTVVFEHSGRWWMLTNIVPEGSCKHFTQLYAFSADSPLSKNWQPHPKNPICFSAKFGRNGGILRDKSGAIYRVRQKQDFGRYGAAASIAKVIRLDMEDYKEAPYCQIEPKYLPNLVGTHHMHCDGTFTVFDFVREESLR